MAETKTKCGAKLIRVRVTFIDELLGTKSADPEIYTRFMASQSANLEGELSLLENHECLEDAAERGKTIFLRDEEGRPCLLPYQVRGFMKGACGALRRDFKDSASAKLSAYKSKINASIFIHGVRVNAIERIPIDTYGMEMGQCERPLRTSGPSGERTALACSESVPAGSTAEFDIICPTEYVMLVNEWLQYGSERGMGQWRNAEKGRFAFEEVDCRDLDTKTFLKFSAAAAREEAEKLRQQRIREQQEAESAPESEELAAE